MRDFSTKKADVFYLFSLAAIVVSCVLVIVLSLTYTFLAEASADDYCSASLPQTAGFWHSYAALQYSQWTGRWLAMSIYPYFFPRLGIDTINYSIFLLLAPLMSVASFYIMARTILSPLINRSLSFFVALAITAIFWAYMPSIGELWYWATGIVEYQLPFFLLVIASASLLAVTRGLYSKNIDLLLIGVAMSSAIALSGLNELLGLYFVAFCALQLILAIIRSDRRATVLFVLVFSVAVVAWYISVSAPGNAVRSAGEFPNSMRLVPAVLAFLYDPEHSFIAWMINPALIFLTIALLAHMGREGSQASWTPGGPSAEYKILYLPVLLCIALLAWFCGRFVVSFAQGTILPGRVSNVLFAVFIASLLLLLPPALRWLSSKSMGPANWPKQTVSIALLLLSMSLITAPNTSAAINDLRFNFAEYRPVIEARKTEVRKAPDDADLTFKKLSRPPRLFFKPELTTDPDYWENKCYAKYYGVKSVKVAGE